MSKPARKSEAVKKETQTTESEATANIKTEETNEKPRVRKSREQKTAISPSKQKGEKPALMAELTDRFLKFKKMMNEELVQIYKDTKVIFQKREDEIKAGFDAASSKDVPKVTTQSETSKKVQKRRSRSRSEEASEERPKQ